MREFKNKSEFNRMVKARTQMLLGLPFIASLVMLLDLIEDYTVKTACTNGEVVKYSPDYTTGLTLEETKSLLAHEALHCVLLHHTRRGGRDNTIWNIAADIVINLILKEAGFVIPENWLYHPEFTGKSTEEIYNIIAKNAQKKEEFTKEFNDKGGDPGGYEEATPGAGKDGSEDSEDDDEDSGDDGENKSNESGSGDEEGEDNDEGDKTSAQNAGDQERKWTVYSKQAKKVAAKMGGKEAGIGSATLSRFIEDVAEPTIDWQVLLRRFADKCAKSRYDWNVPNRRLVYRGLYMPSRYSLELGTLAVVIDTSGSITKEDLTQFAGELTEIKNIYKCHVIVFYVSTSVAGVQEFGEYDDIELKPVGGGGTDFKPAFNYIIKNEIDINVLVYFTDGFCDSYPDPDDVHFPTLWIGTRNFEPKFGEFAMMEMDK